MDAMMAQCISQIRIKQGEQFIDVPCGRCNFCLQNRRKEWSFRLQKELRRHVSAYFLTLTYHDLAIPTAEVTTDDGENLRIPVLQKEDFQKFMKRLRKAQTTVTEDKIKYYAVGEYGSQTFRPHYHAIVFGLHPQIINRIGTIWTVGFIHVGAVTNSSIDYVTKYVINKYDFSDYPVPPFSLISNGIGLDHLIQNQKRYQNEYVVKNDRGYNQVLPRYYREKLKRNAFTQAISNQKSVNLFDKKYRAEVERLRKLGHSDSDAYMEARKMASHNKIGRDAKKGDKL